MFHALASCTVIFPAVPYYTYGLIKDADYLCLLYAGQVSSSTGDGGRQAGHEETLVVLSGYRILPAEELEGDRDSVEVCGKSGPSDPLPLAPIVSHLSLQQPCIGSPQYTSGQHSGRIEAMAPPSKHKCRRSQIHGISSAISICSTSLRLEKAGDPFCTSHSPPDLFLHDYSLSILHL